MAIEVGDVEQSVLSLKRVRQEEHCPPRLGKHLLKEGIVVGIGHIVAERQNELIGRIGLPRIVAGTDIVDLAVCQLERLSVLGRNLNAERRYDLSVPILVQVHGEIHAFVERIAQRDGSRRVQTLRCTVPGVAAGLSLEDQRDLRHVRPRSDRMVCIHIGKLDLDDGRVLGVNPAGIDSTEAAVGHPERAARRGRAVGKPGIAVGADAQSAALAHRPARLLGRIVEFERSAPAAAVVVRREGPALRNSVPCLRAPGHEIVVRIIDHSLAVLGDRAEEGLQLFELIFAEHLSCGIVPDQPHGLPVLGKAGTVAERALGRSDALLVEAQVAPCKIVEEVCQPGVRA